MAFCRNPPVELSVEGVEDAPVHGTLKEMLEEMRLLRQQMNRGTGSVQASPLARESAGKLSTATAGSPRGTPRDRRDSPRQLPSGAAVGGLQSMSTGSSAASGHSPKVVEFSVTVRRIFNVNTIEQIFSVVLNISLQWELPHGEVPPAKLEDDGDWEPRWTPKLRLRSLVEEGRREAMYTTTKIDDRPYVIAEMHLLATLSEQLELHAFPADCQDLTIQLHSALTVDQVRLVPKRDGTPIVSLEASRCLLNDFTLIVECPFTFNLYCAQNSTKTVSALDIKVKLARKSSYYLINVALIMLLICSFVLCAWALHPGLTPERFDVDFSLVLTAVAFKLVLTSMLPPISYLTTLDIYILSGFLFLAVTIVCHAALPLYFYTKGDNSPLTVEPMSFAEEQALIRADMISFYCFASFWGMWNILFATYFLCAQRRVYHAFVARSRKEQAEYDNASDEVVSEHRRTLHYEGAEIKGPEGWPGTPGSQRGSAPRRPSS